MKTAVSIFLLSAVTSLGEPASGSRVPSPNHHFVAVESHDRVTLTDSSGHVLVADDYHDRDYHPERGCWTRSGRFYVYPLFSRGGHSPWHCPFVVADTHTRRTYTDSDLHAGAAVTAFELSADDTISYQVQGYFRENSTRSFSLAARVAKLNSAK